MTDPERKLWVEWLREYPHDLVAKAARMWSRKNLLLPKFSEFEQILQSLRGQEYWRPTWTEPTAEDRERARQFFKECSQLGAKKL